MKKPLGSNVGLYYDAYREVSPGEVLRTPTGRCYRVVNVRVQERGKHTGRQHLRAIVISEDDLTPDDVVVPLHWYARG